MTRYCVTFLFIVLTITLKSQNIRLKFEHLSVTEGLSQSSVSSIAEDKHGFMWFSTLDGLNKFDGYSITRYYQDSLETGLPDNIINYVYSTPDNSKNLWIGTADHGLCLYDPIFNKFKTFTHNKSKSNSLIDNHVMCITGNDSILWVGTEKGLSRFDIKKEQWTNYTSSNSGLLTEKIKCLETDKTGNLWIGTGAGLFKLDIDLNKIFYYDLNKGLTSNNILSMDVAADGTLWVGTDNGIIKYNSLTDSFETHSPLLNLPDHIITALLFDHQEILWIGTKNSGLIRYDIQTNELDVYTHDPTEPSSLSVNSILSIYEDSHHIIWVGTSLGGVNKWNRVAQNLLVFRHNPYNANSLSSNQVRSIYEDKNGTIWIGTVDGGLNKWIADKHKFIHTLHNPNNPYSIPQNHIRTIFQDSKNRFWIGTADSGLAIINPQTLRVIKKFVHSDNDSSSISCNKIWRMVEDDSNRLWIATFGGGVDMIDNDDFKFKHFNKNNNNLSNDFCTTIFYDSKNRIWIGTIDGLNVLYPETGKIQIFKHEQNDSTSLCNNRIYSIIETANGDIWIGTKGGLAHYLGKGKFKNFTVDNTDIPNNVVMGILEDNEQNIWITTNRGLCKFNPITHRSKTYDVKDGLQSNEFLVGSFLKTKSGMFLVGGINGFNAFYPEKIKINKNIPYVVITDLMVSNQPFKTDTSISEKKYLVLKHKQNDLTFGFVAVDYILPEKNQYAYKLEPYDEDWIYCKYQRTARYTNLPPGEYVFRVKGSNNDGIWNEKGTSIRIYIKPAFWQTLAFKIGVIVFIIGSIFLFFRIRMKILKRQKEYLEAEVKRQTKEIRQKNEEIMQQNQILMQQKEEILAQRDQIEEQRKIAIQQRDQIAKHKKEIEDSIHYAKNIQTAALPENKFLQLLFNEFFILFLPRDIVSGDFYWAGQKNGKVIAIAADCTGHGVPGAFMSMLGISFLNKIVLEKGFTSPDEILNRLRANVIKALKQSDKSKSKDGMDISICVIDYKQKTIEFAAANNPMYLIRNNELIEYKADKMPVAIFDDMHNFNKITIQYEENDVIYMFSDGYADQFGGPKSKKFKYSNLKKLLLKIHTLPMSEQKQHLLEKINNWMDYPDKYTGKNYHFQIDDILIFGIKL